MTVYSVVGSSVAKIDERGWPTIWAKGLRLRGLRTKAEGYAVWWFEPNMGVSENRGPLI